MIFINQYLSLTTKLPNNHNIYGLGERTTPYFRLTPRTYTLWNIDIQTPLYINACKLMYNYLFVCSIIKDGSHPFYLDVRKGGISHGVYLRNSNGMDVVLNETSLTYNVIGGKSICHCK